MKTRCVCVLAGLSVCGSAMAGPVVLGFEHDALNQPLLAGQVIDSEFGPGLTISAVNNKAGHPNKAIIFNSAAPTGGDTDLKTPGYHPTNTVALGMILIIAENDKDANGDGLVDVPDDEAAGGMIRFAGASVFTGYEVTLVDIEEQGGSIELLLQGATVWNDPIPGVGDNSVQTLTRAGVAFDEMRVHLAGSGAVGAVSLIPAPGPVALLGTAGLIAGVRRRRSRGV